MRRALPGLLIAGISFVLILAWAAAIVPLDAPDEPAHLQAIMQVRKLHMLPEVHYGFRTPAGRVIGYAGDPAVQGYTRLVGRRGDWVLIPYESMQAPLFYLVAGWAAIVVPADPQPVLFLSRAVAALFGALTVFLCWAAVRELAPRAPAWAAAVAGMIALLPQFCFNSATAANDSAFNCMAAGAFWVWIRGLRRPGFDPWLLGAGAMVGLAVLTKLTGAALLPGLGLVVLFRAGQAPAGAAPWAVRARRVLRLGLGAAAGALAVCGWWLVRNQIVYQDFTGSRDAFRFYHARFQQLDFADPSGVAAFLQQTWESSWGRFGWMSIRLPDTWYREALVATGVLLGLSVLAGARALWRGRAGRALPAYAWQSALVLAAVAAAVTAGYLQYNVGVNFQAQGRYFFALLLPAGLAFTGGLYALAPGRRLKRLVLTLPLAWLGVMNVVGLAATALAHR